MINSQYNNLFQFTFTFCEILFYMTLFVALFLPATVLAVGEEGTAGQENRTSQVRLRTIQDKKAIHYEAEAISSLEKALKFFGDLGDKKNEQTVREVLNSLKNVGDTTTVIDPSAQDAQFHLAIFHYKQGLTKSKINKTGALQELNQALSIFIKLNDKTNEQKVRTAINSLRQGSPPISKSPETLLLEIAGEKNSQNKIEALNSLIQNHPDFVDAYIYRSQIYQANKDYQKAIQDLDRAIALKPELGKLIKIHEIRGELYAEINNTQNAVKDFDLAIQLLQDRELHEERILQNILREIRKYEYDKRRGRLKVTNLPSSKASEFRLANIYYRQGMIYQKRGMLVSTIDKARAIKDLEIALEIFIKISNKTNEQKVRAAINSLR